MHTGRVLYHERSSSHGKISQGTHTAFGIRVSAEMWIRNLGAISEFLATYSEESESESDVLAKVYSGQILRVCVSTHSV